MAKILQFSPLYRYQHHGDEGDGKAEVVLPSELLLEEQPAGQGGETDYSDVVDGKQHHIVKTAHGVEYAIGGKEVDDSQGNASENALVLPFRFAFKKVVYNQENAEYHSCQVNKGYHETHVIR